MRVTFALPSTGVAYFPGLARPVTIEADQLPEAQASELVALVAAARFFDRPAGEDAVPARGGADQRLYPVTVEHGDRHRTLQVAEPIDDPELRRLLRFLEAQVKLVRSKTRDRPGR